MSPRVGGEEIRVMSQKEREKERVEGKDQERPRADVEVRQEQGH